MVVLVIVLAIIVFVVCLPHIFTTYTDMEYIKQLKAENERLKRDKIGLHSEIKQLEAENERLKEECTLYDCGNKEWAVEYKKLEDDYTELLDRLDDITYDKTNYYQTLQEIKETAEENKDTVQYSGICKSILMIITKAEEE